jgi:hypothetical protein
MSQKNNITIADYIKANKIANREIEIKQGFIPKHKVHKNKKKYTRKNFKIEL